MASVDVLNQIGEKIDTIELEDKIFSADIREHLVQQVVVWQLAKRRSGTASTKTRGQVRGGGKKPWRQKGTGRARAGTIRSPIWVGGGIIFGPHPRSYEFSLNRKVRKEAMRSVLSSKLKDQLLMVIDKIDLPAVKTKEFVQVLKNMGLENDKILFVTGPRDQDLTRSSRNLYKTLVLPVEGLNVYDILRFDRLVLLKDAVSRISERLG